jgi:hypothetical protein
MESLSNWMDNCKPLVRSEVGFLGHRDDLGSLAIEGDRGALDELAEWLLIKCVPTKVGDMVCETSWRNELEQAILGQKSAVLERSGLILITPFLDLYFQGK